MKVTELGREVVDIHVEYESVRMIEKVQTLVGWDSEDEDEQELAEIIPPEQYQSTVITYTGTGWHTLQAEVFDGGETVITLQEDPDSPVTLIHLWAEHRDALICLLQDTRNEL